MIYNFPYLKDSSFLKKFDGFKLKEQYAKIIVLTFDEKPIQEIEGKVVSGNFTFDGSSSMRRTGTLNMIADDIENDLTHTRYLLSINKKIEVLIGFTNTTDQYKDFPILWFPLGVYVIISPNISHNNEGINISLTLHDKMALLNGECGGTFPASVMFHEVEDIDEDGNIQIIQPTIYQIIQELVNHFGGEQIGKIIISDIDNKAKKVMKWIGSTPFYYYKQEVNGVFQNFFNVNYPQNAEDITSIYYGQDVGYVVTDFIYPGELVSNAGDSVVTILDKIKSLLGNYEYFYDIEGNFRFQEIKNYLNTSYSKFIINQMELNNYLVDYASGKSVYTFENANIIQSYSNSPQYQQIKNDFLIWGKRTSQDGKEIPIRYHLAIDKKPEVGKKYRVFFYTDPEDGIKKAKKPLEYLNKLPDTGEVGQYYYVKNDNERIYKWSSENGNFELTSYTIKQITTTDWRTELYLSGVQREPFGLESNYYYTELKNEWPKIYDVENGCFFEETLRRPYDIDYFLDFIDSPDAISEFGVQNIGRRTVALVDESVNCIFSPDILDIVLIEKDQNTTKDLRQWCEDRKQEYSQIDSQIYAMLAMGGSSKSAYDEIKKELYQYTNYNEQISLTTLPIYYLEPNTRITVRDNASGIYGDYIIKSISLPLDVNGTMTLSCTKALERI